MSNDMRPFLTNPRHNHAEALELASKLIAILAA
jgi:hypothetical protein